jgi:hypothetical protein
VSGLVREGDRVEARGERRGHHVHAHLITELGSGTSVEAHRPPPEPGPERHHLGHTARFVTDHVGCDVVLLG